MINRLLLHVFACLIMLGAMLPVRATDTQMVVGADRAEIYLPMLKGKRVALFSNHTGRLSDGRHTLDLLVDSGVDVRKIFSPEHGFRGEADAGEHVSSGHDSKTQLPIISLFGGTRFPSAAQMADVDVIVSDIQDVGLRFYTYYCTMVDLMNTAARYGKEFMVLDRPNPLGMSVDGPVLDMSLSSGVGRLPIPVLHGLTLGEMARMVVGEGWLKDGTDLNLTVVPCVGYTHSTRYKLPIAPSPNLPTMKTVYLYPSMCFFEATPLSLGRGTDRPFTMYGHPALHGKPGCTFSFTPRSRKGAVNPPLKDRQCWGRSLDDISDSAAIAAAVDLTWLLEALRAMPPQKNPLLSNFFELLIGNRNVRKMIDAGASAAEIKATWLPDVEKFKQLRNKYLLYPL